MQWHIGALLGKTGIGLNDFLRIRILERDAVAGKAHLVEHLAVLEGRGEHRRDGIVFGEKSNLVGVHRAAVNPNPQGAIVFLRFVGDQGHLVPDGLVFFMVVEVPGVVAYFLHVRRNDTG